MSQKLKEGRNKEGFSKLSFQRMTIFQNVKISPEITT
jgi:hypothetical protein